MDDDYRFWQFDQDGYPAAIQRATGTTAELTLGGHLKVHGTAMVPVEVIAELYARNWKDPADGWKRALKRIRKS